MHFKLKVKKTHVEWRDVFRFTARGTSSSKRMGNRMPAVYVFPNELSILIKSFVNTTSNADLATFAISANKYVDVLIQQVLIDGFYYIEVYLNGTLLQRNSNANLQTFEAALIFDGVASGENEMFMKEFDYGAN